MSGTNGYLSADAADDLWVDAFGTTRDEFEDSTYAPFPKGYIDLAQRIVRSSGVVEKLEKWIADDKAGRRGGGRKNRYIGIEQALVVLVMHGIAQGYAPSYKTMGSTLSRRLDAEAAAKIGIVHQRRVNWYFRIYGPLRTILATIDPYYFPREAPGVRRGAPETRINRHRRLTPEQFDQLEKFRTEERQALLQERVDTFMNDLLQASVRLAGKHVANWKGNSALDATFVEVGGHRRRNRQGQITGLHGDPDGGRYSRQSTDHDGSKTKKSDGWGYEAEFATMLRNHPDEIPEFPALVTAINLHTPGKFTRAAGDMFGRLRDYGYPAGLVAADRAYSSAKEAHFYKPLIELGHTLAIDYKPAIDSKPNSELGQQGNWGDLILVEGQWFVSGMPPHLIEATWEHRHQRITDAQYEQRIAERELYRLVPKARMDKDGYQRFTMPDPDGYDELVNPETGEVLAKPKYKSITIPPSAGLKFRQKYPFGSQQHLRWYGMRSLVEHSNSFVKDGAHEALDDPERRRGKGYAYQYLMTTVATLSSNIRKVQHYFRGLERPRIGTSDLRNDSTATRSYRRQDRLDVKAKTADGRTTLYPKRQ